MHPACPLLMRLWFFCRHRNPETAPGGRPFRCGRRHRSSRASGT